MVVIPMLRIRIAALAIAGFGLMACTTSPRSSVDGDDSFPREAWQSAANIQDFGWSQAGIAALEKRVAGTGSAGCLIPPTDHHVLANARPARASVTLHVYGGDLDDCKVFLPATPDGRYAETTKMLAFNA